MITISLFAMLLASCGGMTSGSSVITVHDAWLRPASPEVEGIAAAASADPTGSTQGSKVLAAPALTTSAVYLTIANTGTQRDRLIGATTDAATAIELHQTTFVGTVAQMHQVQALDIPAQREVQIKPGQYHLMLIGPRRALRAGDIIALQLNFERAGNLTVMAQVRDY